MTEKKTRSREGWTRVRFGDVVRLVRDRVDPTTAGLSRFVAGEHMDTDDLRIRRWGNVGDGYLGPAFHMRFKPGHVLYGSRRTYLRKVALADFEGICANTTYVLESDDPSTLLSELLPFIMQTEAFHEHSIKQAKGSVNPYVNFSDLAWYEFDLPPVEEQRRICEIGCRIITVRESLRTARDTFTRVHTAAASALLRGCGKYKMVPLSAACSRVGVGIASSASHAYRDRGVPMIRNNNIKNGYLDTSDIIYLDPEFDAQNASKRIHAGDVITCRTGMPGASAVVPNNFDRAQTFTTLITSPRADQLDSRYLCWWLNGLPGQSYIASRKAGAVQQNLNATLLARMPIALPPLAIQRQIANQLSSSLETLHCIRCRYDSSMHLPFPI